jgi:hypothetical protein
MTIHEGQPNEVESMARTPEVQAVIDNAIDLMLVRSADPVAVEPLSNGGINYRAIVETVRLRPGLQQAAITMALELDGTRSGVDRVANFYADRFIGKGISHPDIDELIVSHNLATTYGVSPEVGEKIIAAEIEVGFPDHASEIAANVIGRALTDDEVLALVDKQTHGASRDMDDRGRYLAIAQQNDVSSEAIAKINQAFDELDVSWDVESVT